MRIHKEIFDAFVQTRIESITDSYENTDAQLVTDLKRLRTEPSESCLSTVLGSDHFSKLVDQLLTYTPGTQSELTVAYLKDVSSMLGMVSAVREACFERHLQSERVMLNLCFAFDHHNYARYLICSNFS